MPETQGPSAELLGKSFSLFKWHKSRKKIANVTCFNYGIYKCRVHYLKSGTHSKPLINGLEDKRTVKHTSVLSKKVKN